MTESPPLVPIDIAVHASNVPAGTIRQWAKRGKVPTACHTITRTILYSLPDLMRAEVTHRNWKTRRHAP